MRNNRIFWITLIGIYSVVAVVHPARTIVARKRWWFRQNTLPQNERPHVIHHEERSLLDRIRAFFPSTQRSPQPYNPLQMYYSCLSIVFIWITTGTLFYSYCNNWPLAQSFFYAVDAGMSIGFCTEVYETKLVSKAFTIVYILLGASVVGGALALFLQQAIEGIATGDEYRVLLEQKALDQADVWTLPQFQTILQSSMQVNMSQSELRALWQRLDQNGEVPFEEFVAKFPNYKSSPNHQSSSLLSRVLTKIQQLCVQVWQPDYRIYTVLCLWVMVGILWGILDQHWDPITATHFAVSALATGGLTAPQVNSDGILPAKPSLFCGMYCLLGIPLFALTLGHFAKVLVNKHVAETERVALTRPLSPADFEVAKHLTTEDSVVHLSDFIVLQLLRQGKLTREGIKILKQKFELLDTDKSGTLTLEQATFNGIPTISSNKSELSRTRSRRGKQQ